MPDNKKRKRDNEDDGNACGGGAEAANGSMIPTTKGCGGFDAHHHPQHEQQQAHFLLFHLQVLKSLYSRDNKGSRNSRSIADGHDDDDERNNETSNDDENFVSDHHWNAIEEFLQKRDHLIQFKNTAWKFRGIQKQALRFATDQQKKGQESPPETSVLGPRNFVVSPAIMDTSAARLSTGRMTPSSAKNYPGSSVCSTPIAGINSNMGYYRSANTDTPEVSKPFLKGSCVGSQNNNSSSSSLMLFARILDQRSAKVDVKFQNHVTKPYLPLLHLTQQKVKKLLQWKQQISHSLAERQQTIFKQILATTNDSKNEYNNIQLLGSSRDSSESLRENSQKRIFEERRKLDQERSKLAETESKIRLWSMLEKELKHLY